MTGKNSDELLSFKKLKDYDLDKIWFEDENYIDYLGFIETLPMLVRALINSFLLC